MSSHLAQSSIKLSNKRYRPGIHKSLILYQYTSWDQILVFASSQHQINSFFLPIRKNLIRMDVHYSSINQIPSVCILMSVFNFILFRWAASYLTLAVSWVCLWQCLFWQQLNLWSFVSRYLWFSSTNKRPRFVVVCLIAVSSCACYPLTLMYSVVL